MNQSISQLVNELVCQLTKLTQLYITQLVSLFNMDLGFRHSKSGNAFPNTQINSTHNSFDNKYARNKPQVAQPSSSNNNQPRREQNSNQLHNLFESKTKPKSKSNVNKYYRSEAAPKNQFKRYLSDVNNVFYEQRESLAKIIFYNRFKWLTGVVWVFLFLTYLAIYFIKPFDGICPLNADCGVFVNCHNGFDYNKETNRCVLSVQLQNQLEDVCNQAIERVRLQWGNQDCDASIKNPTIKTFKLNDLLIGIENRQLQNQLKDRLKNYLSDESRKLELGYQYEPSSNIIYPTQKLYSMSCRFQLLLKVREFQLGFPAFLLFLAICWAVIAKIRRGNRVRDIYKELREKTLKQRRVNISYAKEELEKVYGKIDENVWNEIDQLRTRDREIGYLQDDFLYWQAL